MLPQLVACGAGLGGAALLEEECLWEQILSLEYLGHFKVTLSALRLRCDLLASAAMAMMAMDSYAYKTVSLNKHFVPLVALVMVF